MKIHNKRYVFPPAVLEKLLETVTYPGLGRSFLWFVYRGGELSSTY